MIKSKVTKLNKILKEFKLKKNVHKYFKEAITYIVDKDIDVLDINMKSDVYPAIASMNDTTNSIIETDMRRGLLESYKEIGKIVFEEALDYKDRPTTKKFIILVINKLQGK